MPSSQGNAGPPQVFWPPSGGGLGAARPRGRSWLALFLSLPAKSGTERMRVWRELKTLGCATLRDGVYLLPDAAEHAQALEDVAATVLAAEGSADIFQIVGRDSQQDAALQAMFDRSVEFTALAAALHDLQGAVHGLDQTTARRGRQALERRFAQLCAIDFFPGEAQRQAQSRLDELRLAMARHDAPDEPHAVNTMRIARLDVAEYQGRTWATRARPWADRLASAWLIRRHIDRQARFVWLTAPSDCQSDWLGFDFDGAPFSHVGSKVTFETLLASFGLEGEVPLVRLGALVHALDVGGLQVDEAPGVESLLSGLRASQSNDDALLDEAMKVFDWLLRNATDKTA